MSLENCKEITPEDCNKNGIQLSDLKLDEPGTGHNASLKREALRAFHARLDRQETVERLEELYDPERPDYNTAPQRAVDNAWDGIATVSSNSNRPPFEPELLKGFNHMTKKDVQESSPDDVNVEPLEIVKTLFKADDIICVEDAFNKTVLAEKLGEMKQIQDHYKYINPSVFKSKESGDGFQIARNNPNVLERRYMVLENDEKAGVKKGISEEQALDIRGRFISFCMIVAKYIPLVMAVDTGGKSVHFWFAAPNGWNDDVQTVFNLACRYGADSKMGVLSQKARMPNVSEAPGRKAQRLVYFDKAACAQPWDVDGLMRELSVKRRVFPRVMTSEQMQREYSAPPVEVLRGAVARGEKLQISGSSKAGKTWALLNLAEAVSSGGEFFGIQCVKGKVLFLNFELGETRMRERIDLFNGMHGVDFLNFRGIACDWDFIKDGLAKIEGEYSIFIIDPIYKMLGDNDENSNGDIASLLHHIEEIATERGAAITYSHHFSKGSKSNVDSIDRASGAGAWGRDPDALFSLTAHEQDDCLVFESILRNYKALPKSVWKVKFPRFEHLPDANPDTLKTRGGGNKKGTANDAALEVMQHPEGVSKSELTKNLMNQKGVSSATAYRYIKDAEKAGKVEIIDGKYHASGFFAEKDTDKLM